MNTESSPIMTLLELARYLRVHPSTIYRHLKRGEIPAWKIGSDWRFTKARIDEWVLKEERRFREADNLKRRQGEHRR
jgi:excisionase family DNA binding protein